MFRTVFISTACLVFVTMGSNAGAQSRPRISGYFEHQFSGTETDFGWTQLDSDRLRVDLDMRYSRTARASAAVVWQRFSDSRISELRSLIPFGLDSLIDLGLPDTDRDQYLNHIYVTLRPGPFEIIAGKQYLTWGAAWVFNPTELFRPKRLLEPTYEREGISALSASLPLGSLSDVQIAYVPESDFESSGKLLRVRHHLAGFDLSALVAEMYEQPASNGLDVLFGTPKSKLALGGDISGELFGLGIWAEAAWFDQNESDWIEATLGGNYSLSDGTLFLVEGYYNGRGKSDAPYPIGMWLGRMMGLHRSLGKGIIYGMVTRPFGDLWTMGMSGMVNAGDGSLALVPSVSYAFAQDVDLLFNGIVGIGDDGTEFGADTYGGFIRGRLYF